MAIDRDLQRFRPAPISSRESGLSAVPGRTIRFHAAEQGTVGLDREMCSRRSLQRVQYGFCSECPSRAITVTRRVLSCASLARLAWPQSRSEIW
jgi:hypothetical protein